MSHDPFHLQDDAANPFAAGSESAVDPALNPYAPTSYVSETEGMETDVESFRRQYLNHEASIKSIGTLCMIPGIFLAIIFVIGFCGLLFRLISGDINRPLGEELLGFVTATAVYGGLGGLQYYLGWGLRRFKQSAKRWVVILSSIGLIAFPLGTLINGYILYLLLGQKGKVVFSEAYQDAIRKTPHIKYRTSIIVKVFVGLFIIMIGLGIVAAFFGG